jgi:hypothetical protein
VASARVSLPFEVLATGPLGARVHVIDYDSTTATLYRPADLGITGRRGRPVRKVDLRDPGFHAENVYGLVMHTLGRFEAALGRRVDWQFRAHQIKVIPHAFDVANAYYSRENESIFFGYFSQPSGRVFTCLAHDIVVHETTHALLDGLRSRFLVPSSPDQAAFHEAYADIVALLSAFTLGDVVAHLIDQAAEKAPGRARDGQIRSADVTVEALRDSALLGLADSFVAGAGASRPTALRRSVVLEPQRNYRSQPEFQEPHRRAEVLVAAVMNAFVEVWNRRLTALGSQTAEYLDRARVTEEGTTVATQLLTMAIRAIDYTPPVHLTFEDFLCALLTADAEVRPNDRRYELRATLKRWFAAYGIRPVRGATPDGYWAAPSEELRNDGIRFASLQTDPAEMFRLIWNNRERLRLDVGAYTRVASLRPSLRIGPEDGQLVHETVTECLQYVSLTGAELEWMGLHKPDGMPDTTNVALEGGSTLVFDEYGRLKYEISNRLARPNHHEDDDRRARLQERIDYLWDHGFYDRDRSFTNSLAALHRQAAAPGPTKHRETW